MGTLVRGLGICEYLSLFAGWAFALVTEKPDTGESVSYQTRVSAITCSVISFEGLLLLAHNTGLFASPYFGLREP